MVLFMFLFWHLQCFRFSIYNFGLIEVGFLCKMIYMSPNSQFLFIWTFSFSSTTCWICFLFSITCFRHLCQIFNCRVMCTYVWVFYFVLLVLHVCFQANTTWFHFIICLRICNFNTCSIIIIIIIIIIITQCCFGYPGSFLVTYEFYYKFLYFSDKCYGNFDWDWIDL